ncbi:penicillin acylase family protein [Nocardioides sp.]|uniref:penicillin acylase family protein n=1 Tax=Nocardioides sp. TaxID=35761 RepID=UPI002734229B|nr:penicillin acylase family protein [Nocardioides sp.]MDP3894692.1 penicillin acylase family protein [Nocardioides sp.]
MLRRLVVLGVSLCLIPAGIATSTAAAPPTQAVAPASASLALAPVTEEAEPRKRRPYRATIRRTKHGIPHIVAKDFGSLGFGSGFSAAETSLCNLADTLLTARGQRSRWLGPGGRYNDQVTLDASNLQIDALVTDLRNRRVVEQLLADRRAGPTAEVRTMVKGYAAGVNRYLKKVGPRGVKDPACRGAGHLRTRATELDLWYGVYLANLLASTGVFVKEIVDASPPTLTDPGLPELPLPVAADVDREKLLAGLGRDPDAGFGSNATAIGGAASSTRRGMVLGNPHFPWRGRYRFTQQHLTVPGRYDVAGASLIGSPVVNIGWNKDVAWSHTVSTAYRFTPYEYVTLGPSTYVTDAGPQPIQRRTVSVTVKRPDGRLEQVQEDLYRTAEGYVVDAPALLMPWGLATVWAIRDANAEHLRTIDSFHAMGKATSARDLLRKQDWGGGIPWVNTIAADRFGDALYADHSVVPNVPDSLADVCMTVVGRVLNEVAGLPGLDGTRAGSSCRWRTDADAQRPGIFGPRNLPDTVRRDWVANANDSYWLPHPAQRLEGFAGIIGCERCLRTFRTQMVYRYVSDRLAGAKVTPKALRGFQHANRQRVAELARAGGDLDKVCAAAGGGDACTVLRRWDGRSDTTSRGTHIFQEFVDRLPANAWAVPFDPAAPLTTPRDLRETNSAVVKAMRDAIASLRLRGIPMDVAWGALQVAGDRGAPPIPVGGGEASAGNANAIASRDPVRNAHRYRAVTYGSSHIQSVAFTGRGPRPFTILTYGQSENPRHRWSSDQTRLFSKERWVRFPWTKKQIRRQQVSRVRVGAPR